MQHEQNPSLLPVEIPQSAKHVAACLIAAFAIGGTIQGGVDAGRLPNPDVQFKNPMTWVSAPVADFIQQTGLIDRPHHFDPNADIQQ